MQFTSSTRENVQHKWRSFRENTTALFKIALAVVEGWCLPLVLKFPLWIRLILFDFQR